MELPWSLCQTKIDKKKNENDKVDRYNSQCSMGQNTVAVSWFTTGINSQDKDKYEKEPVISFVRFVLTAKHCVQACPCFAQKKPYSLCRNTCSVKLR